MLLRLASESSACGVTVRRMRCARLFLATIAAAAGQALSAPPEAQRGAAQQFSVVRHQADGGTAEIQLTSTAYRALRESADGLAIELPIGEHDSLTLELERFSVFDPSTRWLTATPTGEEVRPAPDIVMFRGKVTGQERSSAYLSMSGRGTVLGRMTLEGGESYVMRSSDSTGHDVLSFVVQRETLARVPEFPTFCGTSAPDRLRHAEPAAANRVPYVGSPRVAHVAIDADQEFVELFAGVGAAEDYIAQLLGAVSDIYIRDLNIRLKLSFVRTWPLGGEPFSADDLSGFADHWILNEDLSGLNLVHMLSGRRGLPYGGVAYVGGTCSGGTFSISGYLLGSMPSPLGEPHLGNWDVVVVAHEIGHNMGTFHTHDGYTPTIDDCASGVWERGTIMSYCHINPGGLLNTNLRFHARVQDVIAADVAGGDCFHFDCNANDVPDQTDIAVSTSFDVNGNGVPDECEDCNGNGTLDSIDIAGGETDVDANGIPDTCEANCNANLWPDVFEIASLLASDENGNRVPDDCEPDCDGNTIADFIDIRNGSSTDLDRNEVPDACQDCDGNGIADWIDLDRQFNIYLADLGGYVREYLGVSGVPIRNLATPALTDPTDALFGADGQLYVSDFSGGGVLRINVDTGSFTAFVPPGTGGLSAASGLVFHPSGNLLVSSNTTHEVLEFDGATGASLGAFVSAGSGGLTGPYGLQIGPDDNLYVASSNNAILRFSGVDGSFIGTFVSPGSGGLFQPRGMAFKPNGNLLVASFGTNSVLEYDNSGNSLGTFNDLFIPTGAWGVRIGPRGNVFVSRNTGTLRVLEYDVDSGGYVRSYLRGDSGMTGPTGFAFRPASANDCNGNSTLDSCDIDNSHSLDLNDNGIPDECEMICTAVAQPTAGVNPMAMNRYISFAPDNPGLQTAIRVTLEDLPTPYDGWNGQTLWLGEPSQRCENSGQGMGFSPPNCGPAPGIDQRWYWAAPLVCDLQLAHIADWTLLSEFCVGGANDGGSCISDADCPSGACGSSADVYAYHEGILPSRKLPGEPAFAVETTLAVQAVSVQCDLYDEASFSSALTLTQAAWGDVVSTVGTCPNGAPNLSIDIVGDVVSLVNKFSNAACAVTKARSDLSPAELDFKVDLVDVLSALGGFAGGNYPETPSTVNACP